MCTYSSKRGEKRNIEKKKKRYAVVGQPRSVERNEKQDRIVDVRSLERERERESRTEPGCCCCLTLGLGA